MKTEQEIRDRIAKLEEMKSHLKIYTDIHTIMKYESLISELDWVLAGQNKRTCDRCTGLDTESYYKASA